MEKAIGRIISEEVLLGDPFFSVLKRRIQTSHGDERDQLIWDRRDKSFSVALAKDKENNFILIKEPKYGQFKSFLTTPILTIKENETPLESAQRALYVEAGYKAEKWILLRKNAVVDFPDKIAGGDHYFFLALDAYKVAKPKFDSELVLIPSENAAILLFSDYNGQTLDLAMSIVALALGLSFLKNSS
ncbi:MAG: hypothetical protein Q8R18_01710 [bacterium]|nr:hypothetical protein [bacterium]